MWKRASLLAMLACCGGKNSRDCEAYAERVAELSDPVPEQRDMVRNVSNDACTSGRVSDGEFTCANRAATRAELISCTLGSAANAPPPPKPPPSNKIVLAAMQNGGDFKPLDFARNADQVEWYKEVEKAVGACATDQKFEPKEYILVVTFGGGQQPIMLGGLPEPLAWCIKAALSLEAPASVQNGPVDVYIRLGG